MIYLLYSAPITIPPNKYYAAINLYSISHFLVPAQHLGIVSCTVSGVTKVDNRGCQLAVDKAVKSIMLSPGLPDGTKVADYITYFLLVWKEGMSLEAVMENGKFPKQVCVVP